MIVPSGGSELRYGCFSAVGVNVLSSIQRCKTELCVQLSIVLIADCCVALHDDV